MVGVQIIRTPSGEEMAVVPKAEYDELIRIAEEAAEDAADIAAYDAAKADPQGSELLPAEVSRYIMSGAGPLKSFRLWRKLSQVELAEQSGTSQGHISDIESRRRKITSDLAPKLAEALGIPVHWLI